MGVGAAVVGGSLLAAKIGSKASGRASDAAQQGSREARALSESQFKQTRADLAPFRDVGAPAAQQLADFGQSKVNLGDFVSNQPFSFDPATINNDPGVQFRRNEQDRAVNRNSAGLGKFLSGNRLGDILQRSGQLASQEFGKSFNRALTTNQTNFSQGLSRFGVVQGQESDFLARLQNLSNTGLSAATRTGQFGASAANTAGNAAIAGANASAAADIGRANAVQGAIGDLSLFAGLGGFSGGGGSGGFPNTRTLSANPSPFLG